MILVKLRLAVQSAQRAHDQAQRELTVAEASINPLDRIIAEGAVRETFSALAKAQRELDLEVHERNLRRARKHRAKE